MATLESRGTAWRLIFRYGRRRFTKSLGAISEREATGLRMRLEDNLLLAVRGILIPPPGCDVAAFFLSDGRLTSQPTLPELRTLEELIDNYLTEIPETALEPTTREGMEIHRGHLERVLGKRFLIHGLEASHLQTYITKRSKDKGLKGRALSGATIKKEIVTLRTIWNWALQMGRLNTAFPNKGLRYPKLQEKAPFLTLSEIEARVKRGRLSSAEEGDLWDCAFLSLSEITELLEHVATRLIHPHAYAFFTTAAHTGARKSEILRAQVDDLDFASGTLLIREKKRIKGKLSTRRVPLTPKLADILRSWLAVHPGGQVLFPASSGEMLGVHDAHRMFKQNLRKTRWSRLRGWHVFRHSFCTNCAVKGVDQRVINAWVGHQTEEMVRRYRHLVPNQERSALSLVFG